MLKDIATLVQICFYIVGATIAILTYRSAKRGLLNTVNTEYHKRVIDHLENLSKTLYAEFTRESEFYYTNDKGFRLNLVRYVEKLITEYEMHLKAEKLHNDSRMGKEPLSFPEYQIRGLPHTEIQVRLEHIKKEVQSDPFIPDHIADYVVEYLTKREIKMTEASINLLFQFKNRYHDIAEFNSLYERDYEIAEQMVKIALSEKGYGRKEAEIEVHKIRIMIKDYLKSFNPLP